MTRPTACCRRRERAAEAFRGGLDDIAGRANCTLRELLVVLRILEKLGPDHIRQPGGQN
jgi:hypothetical protein